MQYIVLPIEALELIELERLQEFNLDPIKTVDEKNAVLHVEYYDVLFPVILEEGEERKYPYPVYDQDDPIFKELVEHKEEE